MKGGIGVCDLARYIVTGIITKSTPIDECQVRINT